MNLYSFLRKKHRKPFIGAIFAVVFLSAFFVFNKTTKAQTVTTWEFECLFEKLNGNTCTHSTNEADIKSGNRSGIAYGKIPSGANYTTDNGVKAITFLLGINMDPAKAKVGLPGQDKNYFYSRVADKNSGTFVVRIGYKDVNNKTIYKLQSIPYTENATSGSTVVVPTGGIPLFFTNVDYSTNSSGALVKIPFFTNDGSNIITKEVVQATIGAPSGLPEIPYGTEMTADFWYCGGLQNNVSGPEQRDGRYAKRGDRVEYFTPNGRYAYNNNGVITIAYDGTPYSDTVAGLCNSTTENALETQGANAGQKRSINAGTAHYKIGETITFKIPAKADIATDQAVDLDTGIKGTEQVEAGDTLPVCVLAHPLTGSGSFMGCIAQVGYYVLYYPSAWIAGILGRIMDFFLGYSISDESYRASVVVTGWKLVRDISNIFFIIILIWTGFANVFNLGGISMKKVVPTLIINALLINFSLFGTQVVIDISNITARLFYNTMSVCDGKCIYKDPPNEKEIANPNNRTTGGYKPLSEKIVDSFDPQTIFKTETLNNNPNSDNNGGVDVTSSGGGFNASGIGNNVDATSKKTLNIYDSDYAGYFLIVSLIAALIMIAMAKMFFGVMFMFVGRVVGLYMSMIFSPFAVLTRGNMPLVSNIKELSWSKWITDTTNYALLAPIFVFFLYIIYAFINSDMLSIVNLKEGDSFMSTVISVVVPMIIIYMLIQQGVSIAKKYAGAAGEILQKYATQATGLVAGAAVGIATGGAALAGRNIIGRAGARIASSERLQNASAQGGVRGAIADRMLRTGNSLSRSTYDVRNNDTVRTQLRGFGINNVNSRVGNILGTNQTSTTGGFEGAITRGVARQTQRVERTLVTGQQAASLDARNRIWEQNYQTARTVAQNAANAAGIAFDENTFRTNHITTQAAAGNARPQTSAEVNRSREQQNNARLVRGSTLARISRQLTNRVTTPVGTTGAVTTAVGAIAGVTAATVVGGATTVAAAVVGQGAIQNAAAQTVARQRAGNARNPLSPQQLTRLQDRRDQLQQELTRRISLMNTIGATFNPPITFDNLTPANILDYQSDRQRDITSRQARIDAEQSFVDQNKNNNALAAQVNAARATIRTLTNEQNDLRNDMRQAGNVLNEFNRIQTDIDGIRTQLGE